jgi:AsmA protein
MTRSGTTYSGRGKTWLLASVAAVAVVVGGVTVAARIMIDPATLRQQAVVAVWHQTGRVLRVGAIDVRILPYPSVSVRDLALSDMAGGARPDMLVANGLDARLAILPLLHHEIRLEDVRLTHPDLLVERMADGQANWQVHPQRDAASSGPSGASSPSARWSVRIGSVRVQDAVLTWDDRQTHGTGTVALDHVVLDGLTGATPFFDLMGHRPADTGAVFALQGHVGALVAPLPAAWPVHIQAAFQLDGKPGGNLALDGKLSDPARLRGYDVTLHGAVGQVASLNRLFVHAGLPDARDIDLTARIVDMAGEDAAPGGAAQPALRLLRLRTGGIDAGQVVAGLRIDHLAVDAPTPADHVAIQVVGQMAGQVGAAYGPRPFDLHGTLGTLSEIVAAGRSRLGSAMPLDLVADSAGARLHVGGSLGGGQSALDIHLAADRLALPGDLALDRLTADAHLAMQGGDDIQLSGLQVDAAQMALAGGLDFARHGGTGGIPLLSGRIHADRLDIDALHATSPRGAPPALSAPRQDAASGAPAPAGARADTPLDFDRLRRLDIDLDLSASQLRLDGDTYRDALAHVLLRGGRLVVDPLRADGTERHLNGSVSIDASGDVPHLSASVGSLVLPAEWVAAQAGIPTFLHGALQLVGVLDAQGATRAALQSSLAGHLGLSAVNGQIDGDALGRLLGPAAAGAARGAAAGLRCFGVHMGLGGGQATLDTIGMQTYRLSVTGHGTVGLARHDLDLHLIPQLLIGSTGAAMPVVVGGTVEAPQPRPDAAGAGRRFVLTIGPSSGIADPCPATLQAAREGQSGPAPGAAPKAKAPKAMDFLRGLGLFR